MWAVALSASADAMVNGGVCQSASNSVDRCRQNQERITECQQELQSRSMAKRLRYSSLLERCQISWNRCYGSWFLGLYGLLAGQLVDPIVCLRESNF